MAQLTEGRHGQQEQGRQESRVQVGRSCAIQESAGVASGASNMEEEEEVVRLKSEFQSVSTVNTELLRPFCSKRKQAICAGNHIRRRPALSLPQLESPAQPWRRWAPA
jgi:endogenous inhibitor of DNA gyrase (YacG/DUF329 family)